MRQRMQRSGPVKRRGMKSRNRQLHAIFALIIPYSLLVICFQHVDLGGHPDCSFCKFVEDLYSENAAPVCLPMVPRAWAYLISRSLVFLFRIFAVSICTRAPPLEESVMAYQLSNK